LLEPASEEGGPTAQAREHAGARRCPLRLDALCMLTSPALRASASLTPPRCQEIIVKQQHQMLKRILSQEDYHTILQQPHWFDGEHSPTPEAESNSSNVKGDAWSQLFHNTLTHSLHSCALQSGRGVTDVERHSFTSNARPSDGAAQWPGTPSSAARNAAAARFSSLVGPNLASGRRHSDVVTVSAASRTGSLPNLSVRPCPVRRWSILKRTGSPCVRYCA